MSIPTEIGTFQMEAGGMADMVRGGSADVTAEVMEGLGVPRDKKSAASYNTPTTHTHMCTHISHLVLFTFIFIVHMFLVGSISIGTLSRPRRCSLSNIIPINAQ